MDEDERVLVWRGEPGSARNAFGQPLMRLTFDLFIMGASVFPHNAADNLTGLVGALAYLVADAIRQRYLKHPGPLVQA